MKEIWKDIEGWEGLYQISNQGKVKSLARMSKNKNGRPLPIKERIMAWRQNSGGHMKITLCNESFREDHYIHILVATYFVANTDGKPMVNHVDHDPSNNNDWNLEWVTMRENVTHGLTRNGSRKKSSMFPGVHITKENTHKKWKASVFVDGKHRFLGNFYTENEAHEAYQKALLEYGIENKYAKAV